MDPLANPASLRSQNPKLKKKPAKQTIRTNECSETRQCMIYNRK